MSEDSSFVAALTFNVGVGLGFFFFFSLCRTRLPQLYSPQILLEGESNTLPLPRPRGGLFGWVRTVWALSDEEYFAHAGLDALMYTSFLRFGIYTFAVCAVLGLALLLPVNMSAYGGTADCTVSSLNATALVCSSSRLAGLTAVTLANIPAQDSRLWAHFLSAYLFVLTTLFFLERLYRKFVLFRNRFFSEGHAQCHTVLVRDIPTPDATQAAVHDRFEALFGSSEVVHVAMVYPASRIAKFLAARGKVQHRLDHLEATRKPGKQPPTLRLDGFLWWGGRVVDEATHLSEVLRNLDASIAVQQARMRAAPPPARAAFVTLRSMAAATMVAQSLFSATRYTWTVTQAPEARDVHWGNARQGYHRRYIKGWVVHACMAVLVVFWAIPVTAVASLTTLDRVTSLFPFLDPLVESSPAVRAFLEGVLPTLALTLFMAVLPYILLVFATMQGFPSHSAIKFSVIRKLFYFQVVNVFFVSLIAGTVFSALGDLVESPESILTLLGEAIPRTGVFFTNYVMLRAFSLHPGNLARLFDVALFKIRTKWFARTPAERAEAWSPGPFEYESHVPTDMLMVLIGLTYATVAPAMLPFSLAYFATAFTVNRYNMLYVHKRKFETGAVFFPNIFDRVMAGVVIYELTMVGILSIKQAVLQVPLLLPLLAYTLHFWVSRNRTYRRIGSVLALDVAARLPLLRVAALSSDTEVSTSTCHCPPTPATDPDCTIPNTDTVKNPSAPATQARACEYEIPELRTRTARRKGITVFGVLSKLGSVI
eukprot:m.40568 g.40568  ORF g.40568 m.40568 type:complete len:766 (-) comp10358_c0_seq2:92-2389(-)